MFKINDIILNKRFFFFRFQRRNYSVDVFILRFFGNDVLPAISQIHRFCFDIDRSKDSTKICVESILNEWNHKRRMNGWEQASMRKKTTRKNRWWIQSMKNEKTHSLDCIFSAPFCRFNNSSLLSSLNSMFVCEFVCVWESVLSPSCSVGSWISKMN